MMAARDHVIAASRTYLGVPFAHCGRTRLGMDCGGLLIVVARDVGFSIHDTPKRNYGTDASPIFRGFLARQMVEIDPADAQPGDWLLWWVDKEGVGQHAAMITRLRNPSGALDLPPVIIHACAYAGLVHERDADPAELKRVVTAFRYRELDGGLA